MEVILFDNVKNLGLPGDTVKVAEGYFRNFLKPRGLAGESTAENRKRFEKTRQKALVVAAEKTKEAKALAKKLEDVTVTVRAKAGEGDKLFGSVTAHDIADGLAAQGFVVDRKQIEISEHIKNLGLFTVSLKVHPEVEAKVKLLVERA